jgi:hypothetical protein
VVSRRKEVARAHPPLAGDGDDVKRTAVSYGDRNGKYQKQTGVTLARV